MSVAIWILLLTFIAGCGQDQAPKHQLDKDILLLVNQEGMNVHGLGRYTYRYISEAAADARLSVEISKNGRSIMEEELSIDTFIPSGEMELGFDYYGDGQESLVWSIRLGDEQETMTTPDYTDTCVSTMGNIANMVALLQHETLRIIRGSCQTQYRDEYSFVLQLYLGGDDVQGRNG